MARTLMMRRLQFLASVAWACAILVAHTLPAVAQDADDETVQASVSVCFIPGERCFDRIVNAIGAARSGIRVQAYGFTSARVIGALAAAKRRGVVVEAILDKTNLRQSSGAAYTGATYLAHADIPVWIDARPAIAHNKVIIIDQHLVIGGSANYTNAAETRNAENVLFIDSADIAGRFPRQLGGEAGRIPAV
jgi:phospholipase D